MKILQQYVKFPIACNRGYDKEESEGQYNRPKCVKHLVEAGADVNYNKQMTNFTALHWAAYNNDKNSVLYLLKHGAIL